MKSTKFFVVFLINRKQDNIIFFKNKGVLLENNISNNS